MGYEFSIILNREITDEESKILLDGCNGTTLSTAPLPTNADVIATQLEVDNTEAPTLAEAIQSALDAVKTVPDLLPASLTVPAEPNGEPDDSETAEIDAETTTVIQGTVETASTGETEPTDSGETTPTGDGTTAASEPEPAEGEKRGGSPRGRTRQRNRPSSSRGHGSPSDSRASGHN